MVKNIRKEIKDKIKDRSQDMKKCECGCGNPANNVLTDSITEERYEVCSNCLVCLVGTCLNKEQYENLLKNGHKITDFMLHDDYYYYDGETEEFDCLQPRFR